MLRLDAHHHFWKFNEAEYGWIDSPNIRRDFLPSDLEPVLSLQQVDAVISVQARQSLEETRWLLELAAKHAFINGVV
ncbi:MAG: amidohydrolase, partial [Phycisphaerae bacterium]|nr:amidohydrolase [Phycisphaerae bacterium]